MKCVRIVAWSDNHDVSFADNVGIGLTVRINGAECCFDIIFISCPSVKVNQF